MNWCFSSGFAWEDTWTSLIFSNYLSFIEGHFYIRICGQVRLHQWDIMSSCLREDLCIKDSNSRVPNNNILKLCQTNDLHFLYCSNLFCKWRLLLVTPCFLPVKPQGLCLIFFAFLATCGSISSKDDILLVSMIYNRACFKGTFGVPGIMLRVRVLFQMQLLQKE